MNCPNCGTSNPDNAKFCRNCGFNLQENDAFEEEVIHTPTIDENENYRQSNTNTQNNGGSSDWTACCICVIVIFIIFALFSIF